MQHDSKIQVTAAVLVPLMLPVLVLLMLVMACVSSVTLLVGDSTALTHMLVVLLTLIVWTDAVSVSAV
jgi:hypothetical protein